VAQQCVPIHLLQFCLWLMLALRWSPRENGLLAVFLLVCDMPAPPSSRRNALLLLPLLLCCCCCCCYGCWPSGDVGLKVTSGERIKICPRVLPCTPCPACTLRPARINTSVRFQEP
jgi:hypothetical protein